MTNTSQEEPPSLHQAEDVNAAATSIFTSAQYSEIVKMLGAHKIQSTSEPVVNMAGPAADLHHSSHWIIESGAN